MTIYLLLFDKSHNVWLWSLKIKFFPCLKSWLATIPYKKDDKVSKKLLIYKKGKEKKERYRKIEIDSQIKSKNFGLCACVKNKKAV